ncbi:MAG: ATP-binding protein [Muribaculaceae bacterium]
MKTEFINRELATVIKEASKYFSVITVTGPRQSGKTTLLQNIFSELHYFSLENLDIQNFAVNDPVAFLNQYPNGMILDEVHNAPALLSYIQGIVDADPQRRFVLSGSSQFAMLRKVTQSLAGRTAVFELLPFSYSETKDLSKDKSLDELLYNGFYPAIYAEKNIPRFLYQSYVKTYLEKDVRDLLRIKDMMQFHTFIRLCAARVGSLFNASELSNEVGVSSNTIISWLSILQASYIIVLLPPYFENSRKRLTKTPKLYFIDTGLAAYLLGIESAEQLARDKMRGNLFENFVVVEALKHRYNQGKESNLYFYRDSNQNEVDLIIKNRESLCGIEIKSSMTYNSQFEKGLKKIDSGVKEKVEPKAIIYAGDFENNAGDIQLLNYAHLNWLL